MSWFSRFRTTGNTRQTSTAAAPAPSRPEVHPAQQDIPDFLTWLLEGEPLHRAEMSWQEIRAIEVVQKTLALPSIPQTLLPRASALVPQLIALLRESALPQRAIAERVSRDAKLTAEVMRVANSPFYRSQDEVTTLMQAITLIGALGLQTAIARVVLKPILQSTASPTLAHMEERLWEHSEVVAQHAAALAPSAGLQGIDGYISGLLYNTGWKVALRSLDQAGLTLDLCASEQFASALTELSHRLFGLATREWDITPGFTAYASDALEHGLHGSTHPMTRVLQSAQTISMGEMASGMSQTLPAPLV